MADKKAEKEQGSTAKECLFGGINPAMNNALHLLPEILEEIWPLKKSCLKSLPEDIAELSKILTSERRELEQPYWRKPAFISAYLYYFLPWNMIRMGCLFAGLSFVWPFNNVNNPDDSFLLYDIGSGPLTFAISLWLSKPELRDKPIKCAAVDKSPQPVSIGIKIFDAIAKKFEQKPWTVIKIRSAIHALANAKLPKGIPWLFASSNILNELQHFKKKRFESETAAENDSDQNAALQDLLEGWSTLWHNSRFADLPQLLFIEPGTRRGGKLIENMRKAGIECGFDPLTPCTHSKKCPLLDGMRPAFSSYGKSWCHFTFSAEDVPKWLLNLSKSAGLEKQSLSLSFLLLGKEQKRNNNLVRVISRPIKTQSGDNCRYGCSNMGLVLLKNAAMMPAGSLVKAKGPAKRQTDKKSGAIILEYE